MRLGFLTARVSTIRKDRREVIVQGTGIRGGIVTDDLQSPDKQIKHLQPAASRATLSEAGRQTAGPPEEGGGEGRSLSRGTHM